MTVYVDVLIVLNIYVNFFLLRASSVLLHTRLSAVRTIIASVFGSLFSLAIFLPSMNAVVSAVFKLASAFAIVAAAFGIVNVGTYIKNVFFFFAVNFIFCGVIYGVIIFTGTDAIGSNNAYFYTDFSLVTLIVSTALAYLAICVIRRIFDKKNAMRGSYSVIVTYGDKTVSLRGIVDTGNTLTDAFSGLPVIVCGSKGLGLPKDSKEYHLVDGIKGMHFLPYTAVGKSSILPVFSPKYVYVREDGTHSVKHVRALIGIASGTSCDCGAIFNPDILI